MYFDLPPINQKYVKLIQITFQTNIISSFHSDIQLNFTQNFKGTEWPL